MEKIDFNRLAVNIAGVLGAALPERTSGTLLVKDFYGSVRLEDGAGPVLLSAEMTRPEIKRYTMEDDPDKKTA